MKENDYELLYLIGEGNENALMRLYEKYEPMISSKARRAYNLLSRKGIEFSDLRQEAMIGFEEAIKDFKDTEDTLFYTFASICIDRKISTYLKKMNRDKNKILNDAVSFDYSENDDEDNMLNFVVSEENTPEDTILSLESEKELAKKISDAITNFEKKVLNLKLQSYSVEEIAKVLGKDTKSIYNAMQRIREKVKKVMD